MSDEKQLPPGQYELNEFPRFGLPQFANRVPKETRHVSLEIKGDVGQRITISDELFKLPRIDQTSDFHCVTTWTRRSLRWSGFRFSDVHERIVVPGARPERAATFVVLRSQDGYRTSLPLEDLLADDVLLADRLDGEPLSVEHGAPLRLVAPAHYGYKSTKHLCAIELWRDARHFRPVSKFRFMTHARARVALEERGTGVPGWLLRHLYRPLVRPGIWLFRRALERHTRTDPRPSGEALR
jgi:DMSO/TMAO reductase YedYZ molybdopterin-dependent catalytic subunit